MNKKIDLFYKIYLAKSYLWVYMYKPTDTTSLRIFFDEMVTHKRKDFFSYKIPNSNYFSILLNENYKINYFKTKINN